LIKILHATQPFGFLEIDVKKIVVTLHGVIIHHLPMGPFHSDGILLIHGLHLLFIGNFKNDET